MDSVWHSVSEDSEGMKEEDDDDDDAKESSGT